MNNEEIIEKKYAEAEKGIADEWFSDVSTKWYDYVIGLPIQLRVAYLVVIFLNQVFNGGLHQYFVNRYGQFAKETIDALKLIGAFKKADLLKNASQIVNSEKNSDEVFREKLLKEQIPELFVEHGFFDLLDSLDDIYYADETEDIALLLGNFLR